MRFPGNRVAKHYFPVAADAAQVVQDSEQNAPSWALVGLDEVIVDIEVRGPRELAEELGLVVGESIQLDADQQRRLLERFDGRALRRTYAAGGTVANSLNNFTFLAGESAALLGTIESCIRPGTPAFSYVSQTPRAVELDHLLAVDGPCGTAVTFISPDGERSFGVAPGISGDYPAEALPEQGIRSAAVALTSLYCFGDPERPIAAAAQRFLEIADEAGVPVAFGLGTAGLVRRMRDQVRDILQSYVTIVAMNAREAEALTDESDVLLAAEQILEWVDVVVITEGPRGITMGGWTDESVKRQTKGAIRSKSIEDYNRWEYSRLVRRRDCENPLRVYTHIHPYRGGPKRLSNTSGAGDAVLAALLHDIAANHFHRATVPESDKHQGPFPFLTYSSLSRNAQYGNRVAYEVLRGRSPRLESAVGNDPD